MPEPDLVIVARALRAAGLQPSEADMAALGSDYSRLRAMVDGLYEVHEARDELPDPIADVRR